MSLMNINIEEKEGYFNLDEIIKELEFYYEEMREENKRSNYRAYLEGRETMLLEIINYLKIVRG